MTSFATLQTRCVSERSKLIPHRIPSQDEWRKFVSQTCPGPRSAHSVVASPAAGGKLYLFGAVLVIQKPCMLLIEIRWRIFVLVSKQLSSLSRFLGFRYSNAYLGKNRDQSPTERAVGSSVGSRSYTLCAVSLNCEQDGHVETFHCLVWRIL